MGYALFAQKKLVLSGLINSVQLQQAQRSDEQIRLSTNTLTLQSRVSNTQAGQAAELGELYNQLASANDSNERQNINNQIEARQRFFEQEIQTINNQIYQTSVKENAIEMEVKRLDTKLTALQKQLEKLQEAEGNGVCRGRRCCSEGNF